MTSTRRDRLLIFQVLSYDYDMIRYKGSATAEVMQKWGESRATLMQGVSPLMGHSSAGSEHSSKKQGLVTKSSLL